MTISTEKRERGGGDEGQPDGMRDRAVKYLWSSSKEML